MIFCCVQNPDQITAHLYVIASRGDGDSIVHSLTRNCIWVWQSCTFPEDKRRKLFAKAKINIPATSALPLYPVKQPHLAVRYYNAPSVLARTGFEICSHVWRFQTSNSERELPFYSRIIQRGKNSFYVQNCFIFHFRKKVHWLYPSKSINVYI